MLVAAVAYLIVGVVVFISGFLNHNYDESWPRLLRDSILVTVLVAVTGIFVFGEHAKPMIVASVIIGVASIAPGPLGVKTRRFVDQKSQ